MTVPHSSRGPAMQVQCIGAGEPLALVGGGLTGWVSWKAHQERLATSRCVGRFQPLSVEYGLSGRPLPPTYDVGMESRALEAALDELGWIGPIDLVAWSFGALVSLDLALRSPERIRTLTLIEPPAMWVLAGGATGDPDVQQLAPLLRSLHGEISDDQLERWARAVGLVSPAGSPRTLPHWPLWMEHRQSLRNSAVPLDHRDDPGRLEAFAPPVLLVTGTGTPPWLRRITDVLAARFPDARVRELPAGHAPQLVSIDRFLEELAAFHAVSREVSS